MTEEKRFKLEELPDKGSEPAPLAKPRPTKRPADPRLENLKGLDPLQKTEEMTRRWLFGQTHWNWGWLAGLAVLLYLEVSGDLVPKTNGRASQFLHDFLALDVLLKHPLFLVVLFPFIFKLKGLDEDAFELSFDGVRAQRKFVKWNDITSVIKVQRKKREVLEIHGAKGYLIHLIWDIDESKKKAATEVLAGLVPSNHPLRIFIEKDMT